MQYATSNNAIPSAPDSAWWKTQPRMTYGSNIPRQSCNCSHCSSSSSYNGTDLFHSVLQWCTCYKIDGTELVDNVGLELTDFKMWRYNETSEQWVLINEGFSHGAFYLEDWAEDNNASLDSNKILSSDNKTYKCLMNSETNGRCFHPYSKQYNWTERGFDYSTNPCYIVAQMKYRLIKWDENGVDNTANTNLCVNTGGDYWIYKNANFDSQFRHNNDWAVGQFNKATTNWKYTYATTCPSTWDKGFPVDYI